jgi:hypothetical protein
MVEQGEPFAFCGRIVEAYYSNPELDTVAIMWSDGEKNREYYVNVDEEDDQFNALLKEWSYESLDECTRGRNEATRQEFRDAFHRYATEQGLYTHGNPHYQEGKEIVKIVERDNVEELLFEYDSENYQHKEELFKLKLKMFEQDVVRDSKDKTKKSAIRKAETPVEAISAYNTFLK